MADTATATDIDTLSFEQAQAELEQIVEKLEDPHTGLEQALTLWERGEKLHMHCQQKLDYAAARIEKLTVTAADGAAAVAENGEPASNGSQPESIF
jgi:exodeoxyribonuclease VII small subunit